jgi:hypothetical protein
LNGLPDALERGTEFSPAELSNIEKALEANLMKVDALFEDIAGIAHAHRKGREAALS